MPQTSATVNLHDMLADINCSDIQLSSLSVHRHNYAEQHHHLGQQYSKFKKLIESGITLCALLNLKVVTLQHVSIAILVCQCVRTFGNRPSNSYASVDSAF